MKQFAFRDFVIGSVLGFAIACGLFAFHSGAASPPDLQQLCADRDATIEQQKKQIENDDQANSLAQRTIGFLQEELKKSRASIATWQQAVNVENANFGHTAALYKECMESTGQSGGVTVLYEPGHGSVVNVSLLPLPGSPRVELAPNAQLAPRWILPGRIRPQMVGTRKAVYYFYDVAAAQWQGPFAPERMVQ